MTSIETLNQKRADLIRSRAMGQPVDTADIERLDAALAEHHRKQRIEQETAQVRAQIDQEQRQADARAELERLEAVTANALQAVHKAAQEADDAIAKAQAKLDAWKAAEHALGSAQDEARAVAVHLSRKASVYAISQSQRIEVRLVRNPGTELQQVMPQVPRPMKVQG